MGHRLTAAAAVGGLTCLPLLALATGDSASPCPAPTGQLDASPTILGPATLTAAQLNDWWESEGRGPPARLQGDIADVIALYLSEAQAEGVRGDLAFAQAIVETGYFSSSDTERNNFAGIAHYDHATAGRAFATTGDGIRAHIQLLKKYAAGNDTPLARPDVAPAAAAHAHTWAQLAGTWATDPAYWTAIDALYQAMLDHAATRHPDGLLVPAPDCPPSSSTVVGGYSLPVDRHWYEQHPDWFTKPHHDYPAADIPVPTGTPIHAIVAGTVTATPTSGRCGIGIVINGDDGAQYTYCHGQPGTQTVTTGDRVDAGTRIMRSASTGNSTGPHLHVSITIDGQHRCPQPLLVAIAQGKPTEPAGLPATGCTN